MESQHSSDADKIPKALGADRVVSLERLPSQGPLDLLELRADVQRLLRGFRAGLKPTAACGRAGTAV